MELRPKNIFQLDTPFTAVEWPKIPDKDMKLIIELLCSTLSRIGQHRKEHVTPSKGKRSQKRKREEAKQGAANLNPDIEENYPSIPPPPPEIQKYVLVGLNSILRHLQSRSHISRPEPKKETSSPQAQEPNSAEEDTPDHKPSTPKPAPDQEPNSPEHETPPLPLAAILALPTSSILQTHLPTLLHTSSLSSPDHPPTTTRLITLLSSHALQLAAALSLPRVSHIGILDSAPGAETLLAVIREKVPEIKTPWVEEVKMGRYLGVNIRTIESFVGVSRREVRERRERDERERMRDGEEEGSEKARESRRGTGTGTRGNDGYP